MISEDVICSIVSHCVNDVEGVESICSKPVADIAEIIGKKNWGKGLKITIGEDDSVTVDCNINVVYGQSVVTVAAAAQEAECECVRYRPPVRSCYDTSKRQRTGGTFDLFPGLYR